MRDLEACPRLPRYPPLTAVSVVVGNLDYLYLKKKKKKVFTPCKAEQPLRGMELQENEAQKG